MLRSMTGFGRCLVENDYTTQQWEVKSVNSRHLDLKWRLPLSIRSLEPRLEKVVRRFASRGRVDVSLVLQYAPGNTPAMRFDMVQAAAMLDNLQALADARGEAYVPDFNALLQIPSLWGDSGEELDEDTARCLEEGLALALEDWNEARSAEGRALATDMHSRILRMEEWTGLIADRAPNIKEERANALRERLSEALSQNGQELEEGRFLQEAVILADRLDVSEELTRLNTHLARLHDLLQTGGDAGRRLDFTLQECFREINTCGNKLPDVQLSRMVVDFKNELEKCREQVQNLE
ncbi:YicC/YloC family endoribonuclease [Desulfovibrio sp. UIB00]|uniref:YicC/YloC family endoribonuclease n=1 Tax=Desulfovibrio sp. UIB00 TaxID=2804314 RepID=UPI001F0F78B9|nr:YicC/YloC family endoribonuclease [Desulfovibrio sp. UIB00]MCH5145141.1 YicC family protein [Desulfovibrio sp. UIB00]